MKKIIFILFFIFLFISPLAVYADNSPVTLSDAVYADLAVNHYLDNVSLYFTDGKSADDIKLNETRHWLPASTVKLFAAMYAYKLIHDKQINLTDTVTITDTNEVPTELVTDDLPTLLTGDTVTIERLIRQMIIQSDNTAFNQLLDILGRDNVTQYVQSLGLTHTHIGSKLNLDESQTQYEYDVPGYGVNTTTAAEYAKAFLLIKNNKIPGAKDLFSILKDQRINNMIPYYLPKNVICAHKTGDLDPLFHDGGICQDKKSSYVLTIFTNAGDPNLLAHLSQLIYTRNFNLVGQNPDQSTLGEAVTHPIDPLTLIPHKEAVLGATAINFPIPDITAADLGVKASDLSLTIPNAELPHVVIPADSPFHVLSDAWEIVRFITAPNAKAKRDIDLEIGKLRLAEVQDLLQRGQVSQAQQLLSSIQNGIEILAKDPTMENDPIAQNTLQSISETQFDLLNNILQKSQTQQKLQIIKTIANDAKKTIQTVEPNLPEAMNATNPSQKPLTGQIVKVTSTQITVKTAGGQNIIIPTNDPAIKIKGSISTPSSATNSGTFADSRSSSTTASIKDLSAGKTLSSLTVGSTIAVIGTNRNNVFAPTLIIPNVPSELIAPQPVIVKKVTPDHIVVEENGIYTQVNVNHDTTVKA
ncbi:MAG TPA: serine hydrolase, partial [Clostridia bacterium]